MSEVPFTVIVPGSFDPFTIGHLDIVRRATRIANRVIVAVGVNPAKHSRWDADTRVAMIAQATADLPGVEAMKMDGALIDFARTHDARVVVKGIRDSADLVGEQVQAAVNAELGDIETIWLPTLGQYAHISSSMVKQVMEAGLNASRYVPPAVWEKISDN